MLRKSISHHLALFLLVMLALVVAQDAMAGTATNLPWEAGVTTIVNSLTGPIALALALLALVASGAGLVWGGEMADWIRKTLTVVLIIAVIVSAAGFLQILFPGAGAVVA